MNPLRFSVKPLAVLAMLLPVASFADEQYGVIFFDSKGNEAIAGKETIAGVSDLIPLQSFALGISGSKPDTLDLDKRIDATSPLLEQAVAKDQHFGSAELYVSDSVGTAPPQLSLMYTFSNLVAQTSALDTQNEFLSFRFSNYSYKFLPVTTPPVSASELDVSSAASEATLFVAGLFILCARRRKNDKSVQVALA